MPGNTGKGNRYRKLQTDFGEADFLPGLVVDKFSDVLVVQSLALGIDRLKLQILELLKRFWKRTVLLSEEFTREAMPR